MRYKGRGEHSVNELENLLEYFKGDSEITRAELASVRGELKTWNAISEYSGCTVQEIYGQAFKLKKGAYGPKAKEDLPCCDPDVPMNRKIHDDLCDHLADRGYNEADICTASVGIWATIKICSDLFSSERDQLKAEVTRLRRFHTSQGPRDVDAIEGDINGYIAVIKKIEKERDVLKAEVARLQAKRHPPMTIDKDGNVKPLEVDQLRESLLESQSYQDELNKREILMKDSLKEAYAALSLACPEQGSPHIEDCIDELYAARDNLLKRWPEWGEG